MTISIGRRFGQIVAFAFVAGAFPATPSFAQTTQECTAYSIQRCSGNQWSDLGYSSLKDCRLQEYANCMNGGTRKPASFKLEAATALRPAAAVVRK